MKSGKVNLFPKGNRDSKVLIEIIQKQSDSLSIQGVNYILQPEQSLIGRIFWTLVVFSMMILAGIWSVWMYQDWQSSPILTTVTTTAHPVNLIEFPAVTICGFGMIEDVFNAAVLKQFLDFLNEINQGVDITPFDAQNLLYVKDPRNMTPSELEMMKLLNFKYNDFIQAFFDKVSPGYKKSDSGTDKILLLSSLNPDIRVRTLVSEGSKFPKNILKNNSDNILHVSEQKYFDNYLNPEQALNFETKVGEKMLKYKSLFSNIENDSMSVIFSNLWYSYLPCYDVQGITANQNGDHSLLKQCKWKGRVIDCAAIFKKFPTDQGLCCSFNMKAADEIFNAQTYSKRIDELQKFDESHSFGNSKKPDWYSNANEPQSLSGKNKGLFLMLDAHSNILTSGSVDNDLQGFVGLVHNRGSFPLVAKSGFQIRPGSNNMVALSAVMVNASENIRSIEPERRNCRFPDEIQGLRIHRRYTQSNCQLECSLFHAQKTLFMEEVGSKPCSPWYFPFEDLTSIICDPWKAKRFLYIMMSNDVGKSNCDHCLPDCQKIIYSPSFTTLPFRKCTESNLGLSHLCNLNITSLPEPYIWGKQVLAEYSERSNQSKLIKSNERIYKGKPNIFSQLSETYNAFEKDIATVEIFFETPSVLLFNSEQRQTWISFLSGIGGILGLCIGISIVSFVEIFWFCFQLGLKTIQ